MPHISVFQAWLINLIVLAAILTLVPYFVGRDARKRQADWGSVVFWATLSALTFPIGLILYVFVGRKPRLAQ